MQKAQLVDTVIVGAGPAGVQMAYYQHKRGRNYVCLEAASAPGHFFARFPRHRYLISINKKNTGFTDPEINLRWDWNSLLVDESDYKTHKPFGDFTEDYFPNADFVVEYLTEYIKTFRLNVICDARAHGISKDERTGLFTVKTEGKNGGKVYQARCVVMASGFKHPFKPNCPGDNLIEDYPSMSVDPIEFKNKAVLVIGKGNSGFETADNLIHTTALIHVASPNPLQLAWKSHYIGHLRAVNNNLLDTYQLKAQNAVLDCHIRKIEKKDGKFAVDVEYTHALGEKETLYYDRVLNCTGFRVDTSHFDQSAMPVLTKNSKFPRLTNQWESANVKGMFYCGVLSHERDWKKTTSGFIHGFRYCVRTLANFIDERYHNVPYPARSIVCSPDSFLDHTLARLNRSSALWQEFGFLADLIYVNEEGKAQYLEELPKKFVHESAFSTSEHYYLVTLEFGKICGDPFAIERKPVPSEAAIGTFLHPVVRRYMGSKLMGELHLLEDLYTDWTHQEKHVKPLRKFFADSFADPTKLIIMGKM
jgi:thioredoxin reductase